MINVLHSLCSIKHSGGTEETDVGMHNSARGTEVH